MKQPQRKKQQKFVLIAEHIHLYACLDHNRQRVSNEFQITQDWIGTQRHSIDGVTLQPLDHRHPRKLEKHFSFPKNVVARIYIKHTSKCIRKTYEFDITRKKYLKLKTCARNTLSRTFCLLHTLSVAAGWRA